MTERNKGGILKRAGGERMVAKEKQRKEALWKECRDGVKLKMADIEIEVK